MKLIVYVKLTSTIKKKRYIIIWDDQFSNIFYIFQYCDVGRVAHEVGWKYREVISNLETKRKIKSRLSYLHKKKLKKLSWRARSSVATKITKQNEVLKDYGFLTSEFEKKTAKAKPVKIVKLGKTKRKAAKA